MVHGSSNRLVNVIPRLKDKTTAYQKMPQGDAFDGNSPPQKRRRTLVPASRAASKAGEPSTSSQDVELRGQPDVSLPLCSPMNPKEKVMLYAFIRMLQECDLMAVLLVGLLTKRVPIPLRFRGRGPRRSAALRESSGTNWSSRDPVASVPHIFSCS
jgi:hypothetical protein